MKINKKLFNKIYYDLGLNNNNYFQLYFGGSSSGKSYFLAQRIVLDVFKGRNYLICRKVQKTIRGSIFNEIKKALINFGLEDHFVINKTDLVITCKWNRKQICFVGLDDVEKVKSITPVVGVFTDIFVEEATEISEKDFRQLKKRLRGFADFEKRITLAFNPVLKEHWIYKTFFDYWIEGEQFCECKIEGMTASILKTTYKDNEFLTEQDIANLEGETDKYFYNVYTLGNWGILGKLIFNNWKVADLTEEMKSFDNIYFGLDWGFFPDPFTMSVIHIDLKRRKLYIIDEIYEHGKINDDMIEPVKEMWDKWKGRRRIVADSAEPKSIEEYKRKGVKIVKAIKGPGSIERGIKKIQSFEVIIHYQCINAKNEFSQYKYKEDKDGNILPMAVDKFNHWIDCCRYSIEELELGRKVRSFKKPI